MSLIEPGPRSATVKAVTDIECFVTTYDEFIASAQADPAARGRVHEDAGPPAAADERADGPDEPGDRPPHPAVAAGDPRRPRRARRALGRGDGDVAARAAHAAADRAARRSRRRRSTRPSRCSATCCARASRSASTSGSASPSRPTRISGTGSAPTWRWPRAGTTTTGRSTSSIRGCSWRWSSCSTSSAATCTATRPEMYAATRAAWRW